MAAVPKHDGKKKRKCDDGKQSCLSEESEKKKTPTKFMCKIEWKATYIDILKVLYINFFLVGYAILKDFSYLFGTKFTSWNSTCDIVTIDQ